MQNFDAFGLDLEIYRNRQISILTLSGFELIDLLLFPLKPSENLVVLGEIEVN